MRPPESQFHVKFPMSVSSRPLLSSAVTVVIPTSTPQPPRQNPAESKSASNQQSGTSTRAKRPPRGRLRILLVWKALGGFCLQSTLSSWSGSLQRGRLPPAGNPFVFVFLVFWEDWDLRLICRRIDRAVAGWQRSSVVGS